MEIVGFTPALKDGILSSKEDSISAYVTNWYSNVPIVQAAEDTFPETDVRTFYDLRRDWAKAKIMQ